MDGESNGRVFIFRREQSQSLGELFAALAKAKLESDWSSQIKKNSTAQYGKFANLAALIAATERALALHSLVVDQTFHFDADPILLVTELGHGGSGQFMRSILPIPKLPKVQETKSAITYMRRAGYEAILGLAPSDGDDDGDAASSGNGQTPEGNGQWRNIEMSAKQAISRAKDAKELIGILERVQARFEQGSLPADAVDRLQKEAANKRESLPATKG